MAIYRELMRNNISGFLADNFPVLKTLMPEDHWNEMVGDFFARHHSESPYFAEIAQEFIDYLQTEREQDEAHAKDPAFILELAHYEWVELALSIDETDLDRPREWSQALLGQVFVLSPAAWPLAYLFPVHRLSPEFQPDTPPDHPSYIVVYRDVDDQVRFLEINPVTYRLLELLKDNQEQTVQTLCEQIAGEINHPQPEVVIQGGESILQDLYQRGIVLLKS